MTYSIIITALFLINLFVIYLLFKSRKKLDTRLIDSYHTINGLRNKLSILVKQDREIEDKIEDIKNMPVNSPDDIERIIRLRQGR